MSEFGLHETYVVDILMSTGEGKVWCVRVWSVRGEGVECEGMRACVPHWYMYLPVKLNKYCLMFFGE